MHEITVKRIRNEWRAECTCGWTGSYLAAILAASQEGEAHVMAETETVVIVQTLTLTTTTTATPDGVTTVYRAQAVELPDTFWESADLGEVLEWSRGYLGTRML